MALVFHRRLAIPLWAIAFVAVALTAPPRATPFVMPPITLFVMAAIGIAAIVFLMPRAIPWLGTSRALVRVRQSGHRDHTGASATVAAGTSVRPLDRLNGSTADDALDLHRMDDDGAWQIARPPA